MTAVIEMRTYRIVPGMRSEFLEIFLSRSLPTHRDIGMKVLGPFLSVDDEDVFFWMRAFPDAESREELRSRFYDGPVWTAELEGVLLPMLESFEVVLVEDAHGWWDRWPE